MEILSSYNFIIGISLIIILSFCFNAISKKTNIPAVLMLIVLGIIIQYCLNHFISNTSIDLTLYLEILGIVGLIMIVLEAALELKLKRNKIIPILKAFAIAFGGVVISAGAIAFILLKWIPTMNTISAWLYATPLSILSSAIIIPSISSLSQEKKEFHIYESTFSDIIGIILFYFLTDQLDTAKNTVFIYMGGNIFFTIVMALMVSYVIIFIFQRIQNKTKHFLLISVLLLLYALGKKMHLSSLIIILIFGLILSNMKLFFPEKFSKWIDIQKVNYIYADLHMITNETAFIVRTFFFVIFGMSITISTLWSIQVMLMSICIIFVIYTIRFVLLRLFMGQDIFPQLFIAPRGLITVLLFYAIPTSAQVSSFKSGILLFVIISTSIIMTWAMIKNKQQNQGIMMNSTNVLPNVN